MSCRILSSLALIVAPLVLRIPERSSFSLDSQASNSLLLDMYCSLPPCKTPKQLIKFLHSTHQHYQQVSSQQFCVIFGIQSGEYRTVIKISEKGWSRQPSVTRLLCFFVFHQYDFISRTIPLPDKCKMGAKVITAIQNSPMLCN